MNSFNEDFAAYKVCTLDRITGRTLEIIVPSENLGGAIEIANRYYNNSMRYVIESVTHIGWLVIPEK